MISFSIETSKKREVLDLTGSVQEQCKRETILTGLCFLTALHTTTALSIADLDPGTDMDMLDAFEKLIPKLDYRHPHNPDHAPDHILSSLIGPSIFIPIEKGILSLGTWQRVVLFEFDGPRERHFKMSLLSEEC